MKRVLIAVLVTAVMVVSAQVFAAEYGSMKVGLKGGLNISGFHGDDAEGWDSRIGGCVGALAEFPINNMLSFAPELLYTMKGAKADIGDEEVTWKLSYIEIPMLFKFAFPTGGAVNPMLLVGPEVAFKTSSKLAGGDVEVEFDEAKSTDVGFIVGGGIGFPFGTHSGSVEVRYDLGLTNMVDVEDADVKNDVISFLFGISF